MASMGRLYWSFQVLMCSTPRSRAYRTVRSLSAIAIPRPRAARRTPVKPCPRNDGSSSAANMFDTPWYRPSRVIALKEAPGSGWGASVAFASPRVRLHGRPMTPAPVRAGLVVQLRAGAASPEVGHHRDVDPVRVRDECPRRVVQLAPPHHSAAIFRDEARFEVLLRVPR